ncbi:hypothetical protein F4780DRAFT_432529 [Xylariomycetidae sp. FL0641]|nr:hypothetical protein F4780DRAFT_432529 [Xylariomycetidae sp. FL0641]
MRAQPILLGLAALFATSAIAQDPATTTDDAAATTDDAAATTATPDAATTTADDDAAATTDDTETTGGLPGLTTSTSETSTPSSTSTTDAASETGDLPGITSAEGDLPPLPTLAGSYSYPAPTVPPTKNAPYMQPSSMPEGTVFIAVGAILGFFGAAVLLWRAIVACLLHRNVKRAALAQHMANDKAAYPAPTTTPFYKYTDQASASSLGNNLASGIGARRTSRAPIPSVASQSNLFFSPTAPGASGTGSNRESRFLPSGFYAAGAGAPPQGHDPNAISMTNLRPDSHGLAQPLRYSPPDSPNLTPNMTPNMTPQANPRRPMARRNMSTSTLNLNRPASQRAPSAYLDDLLADNPEQFPPSR